MGHLSTRRWRDLFFLGRLHPRQWYREPDRYSGHTYADRGDSASWTNAGQPHLLKSHRGLFPLFCLL